MSTTKVNKEELISLGSELSAKSKELSSLVSALKGSLSKISNYDDIDVSGAVKTLSKNLEEISTDVNNVSLNISNYASKVSDFDVADFSDNTTDTTKATDKNTYSSIPSYYSNNTSKKPEESTEATKKVESVTNNGSLNEEAAVISTFTPLAILESLKNPSISSGNKTDVEKDTLPPIEEVPTEAPIVNSPIVEERPYTYKVVAEGNSFVFKKIYLDTGADVESNVSSPSIENNAPDGEFSIGDIGTGNNVSVGTNPVTTPNTEDGTLKEDGTLVSGDTEIDLSKYNNKIEKGFEVTQGNTAYSLDSADVDLLCAIVAAESDKTYDDALAVITTILNRCEAKNWVRVYGTDPLNQATAPNQFVVYQEGYYERYINGKAPEKVKIAVQDALAGVRNHNYLSFRSGGTTSYSDNRITDTGNRYK